MWQGMFDHLCIPIYIEVNGEKKLLRESESLCEKLWDG